MLNTVVDTVTTQKNNVKKITTSNQSISVLNCLVSK